MFEMCFNGLGEGVEGILDICYIEHLSIIERHVMIESVIRGDSAATEIE